MMALAITETQFPVNNLLDSRQYGQINCLFKVLWFSDIARMTITVSLLTAFLFSRSEQKNCFLVCKIISEEPVFSDINKMRDALSNKISC
jgi:hypothetical protein